MRFTKTRGFLQRHEQVTLGVRVILGIQQSGQSVMRLGRIARIKLQNKGYDLTGPY